MAAGDRLRFLAARLRAMELREIPFRVREQVRRRAERWAAYQPPPRPAGWSGPTWPVALPPAISVAERRSLAADTRALLEDGFTLLGSFRAPAERTAWHRDPQSGAVWPMAHTTAIDLRPAGLDVKQVLELGRLQHLQILALRAAAADDDAREALFADLQSWFAENPPYRGVHYAVPLELACRATSLVLVASLLPLPEDLLDALWGALHAHGRWIARFPSLYSSANNHRIGELAALVVLGGLVPGLPDSEAWLAEGVAGLREQVERQILPDGIGAEQSPSYQAFTMEWTLLARLVAAARGEPLGPVVDERLARGAAYLASLLDRDGHAPSIGDDDGCVVLRRRLAPERYVASVAHATAAVLGRTDRLPPGWAPDLRARLLGAGPALGTRRPASCTFPDGGVTVLRSGTGAAERVAVVDHGPLGFPGVGAHGHADALALWLSLGGWPLLVDAGTYRYNGAPRWRAWFRGTAAHNTATVDGLDQSEQRGAWTWASRARCRLIEADETHVVAEHDGYEARLGVVHRRAVRLDAGALVLEDRFEGSGTHQIALYLHLAPGLDVRVEGDRAVVRDGERVLLEVTGRPLRPTLATPAVRPGPGVCSPSYGVAVPAPCLVLAGPLELPVDQATRVTFGASTSASEDSDAAKT